MIKTANWRIYVPSDREWELPDDLAGVVDHMREPLEVRAVVARMLDIGFSRVEAEAILAKNRFTAE